MTSVVKFIIIVIGMINFERPDLQAISLDRVRDDRETISPRKEESASFTRVQLYGLMKGETRDVPRYTSTEPRRGER